MVSHQPSGKEYGIKVILGQIDRKLEVESEEK
jgi:hypothetical protein